MSEENVELVSTAVEEWQRGDEAWMRFLDPEIEWDNSAYPAVGVAMGGKGRASFVEFLDRYLKSWRQYEGTAKEIIDAGDDVVVVVHETIRARGSDAPIERRLAQIWTLNEGLAVRYRSYPSKAEALEAAGLRE
jgi:ketosteroid isomerase-like protein